MGNAMTTKLLNYLRHSILDINYFKHYYSVEKLPICVLCDEDEEQPDKNTAILDFWQYILYFAFGCLGCLFLCSGLLAIPKAWRWLHQGKVEMKKKSTTTNGKTPTRCTFLLRKERVTGTTATPVKNQHRRHKGASKIQLLYKERRDVPMGSVDVRLTHQEYKQDIKRGKRSGKTVLEKKSPTMDPSRDLDALLCVKPNCQKHSHSKPKFHTKSQMEKIDTVNQNDQTAAKKSQQKTQENIQVDDIGCLTELGTPLHSSTFVHCNLSHNGSFMEAFVDTLSRDDLDSQVKVTGPCDNEESAQYVNELETPSFEIHHDISSEDLTSFHDLVATSHDETSSDEKNGSIDSLSSFGGNTPISYPSVHNSVNMGSSVNSSDTSSTSFLHSFQHLASRSPAYVQNALERTKSSAKNLVLQARRTGYNTLIFIVQTADDILYVIECARGGRRCVVRRIHKGEKSLLCDIAKENLDWDVYDYMRVFDEFGDETNTAIHLVAAVVVKSAMDKARSFVNRHLDGHSSSFLFNDSFISLQGNRSFNASNDFSYECLI